MIATLVAAALLLCVRYDWWPLVRNLDNDNKLVMIGIGTVILLFAGACWLTRTALFVFRRRQWSWFIIGAPAIISLAAVLAFVPGPPTFDDQRATFDEVAREVIGTRTTTFGDITIGRFDISGVQVRPDGAVYFYDADVTSRVRWAGWVYSPTGTPSFHNFDSLEDLGDGWYRFSAGT